MTAEPDSPTSNGTSAASNTGTVLSAVPEGLRPTVQTLIAQVEVASKQLQALQDENERLRARIQTLEQQLEQSPNVPESALVLPLEDTDADALVDNLDAYIEAIDTLLQDLPAPSPESDPSSAADVPSSA